jgi:uncharacterized protein (UPF0261 family)
MPKYIALVGTLDTKGNQIEYVKKKIEEGGQRTRVIDIGVAGEPPFKPDYDKHQVAKTAGTSINEILEKGDRRGGLEKMGEGASSILKQMYQKGELSGVLGFGGSQGTAVVLLIIKTIPLGVPKLVLSTIAYSRVMTPDVVGGIDFIMVPWVLGLWGLNSLSEQSLETAAGAISGAARNYEKRKLSVKQVVGVSSLGGSVNRYMYELKPALEKRGYEVAVSHVLGMPGIMYERAILDGFIAASLDLSVGVELLNEITDGVYTAGKHRLEAAGQMGIPQIVSPGAIEVFHWGNDRPLPKKYKDRPGMWHNALHRTVGSSVKEMAEVGTVIAEKLNKAKGPSAMVLPLQSLGMAVMPNNPHASQEAIEISQKGWQWFKKNLIANLSPKIKYIELDTTFNDPLYTKTILELFDEMMKK